MTGQTVTDAQHARYSGVAMALHWIIALLFVFVIGLGWRMEARPGPETFAVYQLHKSVGITILALSLLRLFWRWKKPPPALPADLTSLERLGAHVVHVGLYALLLGLPLSGWLLVSSSPRPIPTILYGLVHLPDVPRIPAIGAAGREGINGAARLGHHSLVTLAYVGLFAHIAGALKHQFVDRTDHFGRMMPLARKALGAGIVGVLIVLLGTFLFGNRVHLRPIAPVRGAVPAPAVTGAAATSPQPELTAPPAEASPEASAQASTDAAAEPSTWQVQRASSSLRFSTSYAGTPIDGAFASWDADIRFDPAALARSRVNVSIALASVTSSSTDAKTMLPGADFFAADRFAKATFAASKFTALGGDRYRADGTLTLRGKTRPQRLEFTLRITGDRARMSASTSIDRTAFGVGQGEWANTADLPAAVPVTITLTARREP